MFAPGAVPGYPSSARPWELVFEACPVHTPWLPSSARPWELVFDVCPGRRPWLPSSARPWEPVFEVCLRVCSRLGPGWGPGWVPGLAPLRPALGAAPALARPWPQQSLALGLPWNLSFAVCREREPWLPIFGSPLRVRI